QARHGKIRIMKERMGVYRLHKNGLWSGLQQLEIYYKILPVVDHLFHQMDAEHQDNVRIYFMNLLEQAITIDSEKIMHCEKTKVLYNEMQFRDHCCIN